MEETVNEHYRALLKLEKPWRVAAVEKDLRELSLSHSLLLRKTRSLSSFKRLCQSMRVRSRAPLTIFSCCEQAS